MSKNFLKKIREEKGISQINLAKKIGIARSHICNFESGKANLSPKALTKIAKALEVDVSEITKGVPDHQISSENKDKLLKSMIIASEIYGDDFDKEMVVNIATEVYSFLRKEEAIENEGERKVFQKSMQSKYITGLAANCLLKMKK